MAEVPVPAGKTAAAVPKGAAYLVLGAAVLAAASSSIWIRLSTAPSLAIAFWRLALATAILAVPLGLWHRQGLRELRGRDLWLAAAAGGCLALHFAAWVASLRYTSVASSTVLVTTHPFLVLAAGRWLLRERVPPAAVAGVLLAVLGGALVGWGDFRLGGTALYGDLLALAGAVAVAGYILIGRAVRQRVEILPYTALVYGVAALTLLLLAIATGTPVAGYPAREWWLFLALAVFPTVVGHTAMNWALRYLRAAVVSVSILGEPVGATGLAFLLFGEVPGGLALAGGALILTGIGVFLVAAEGPAAGRARGGSEGSRDSLHPEQPAS